MEEIEEMKEEQMKQKSCNLEEQKYEHIEEEKLNSPEKEKRLPFQEI